MFGAGGVPLLYFTTVILNDGFLVEVNCKGYSPGLNCRGEGGVFCIQNQACFFYFSYLMALTGGLGGSKNKVDNVELFFDVICDLFR